MRARCILLLLIIGSMGSLFACQRSSGIDIGDIAPDIAVKDESGKVTKLSDLRGNVVLLNFWATWCIPCQDEAPDLDRLYREFSNRKFRMMAVSVDTEWDLVHAFNKKYNVNLPTYLDPGQQQARKFKVEKFPETFIIDRNGRILKHFWTPPQGWPKFMTTLRGVIDEQETAALASP
jgi:peroxiredoxin